MERILDGTPDPPATDPLRAFHHRLVGPERAAVRRVDRRSWLLVSRERLRRAELPLGLHIELGRKDAPRDHSRTTEPAVGSRRVSVPVPPVPPGAGALLATGVALLAMGGFAAGHGASEPGYAAAILTLPDLAAALAMTWVGLAGLLAVEGALLSDPVHGTSPLVWLRRGLPEVEPVCWRLGIPVSVAVLPLLLAASVFACAAGWHRVAPAITSGLAVGAILYGIQALYPLRPGPGARVLEVVTGVEDLPTQLRWALVERFLPFRSRLEVGGTRTMAVAGFALAGWAAATGQLIHGLSTPSAEGLTLAGSLWHVAATLGLIAWAAWLAVRVGGLFLTAARIGTAGELEALTPSPDLEAAWERENPLNRHVPELRSAPWRWGLASRGSLLIRHGADDRDFYWVARGRVHVIGRSGEGDPLHLTTVRGSLGIGEVALLTGEPRTADVVAAEDTVVAVLSREAFESALDDAGADRFRDVVLASQALARAPTFWGLSPDARGRWLSNGKPARYGPGDIVLSEGEEEQWVGLVVRGRLAVEMNGRKVAALDPDAVFGEMAYLTGRPRSATLRAEEPTVVWRWDAEWLDRELVEAGAADELRDLAEERTRVTG